jgi:hypothetical protein
VARRWANGAATARALVGGAVALALLPLLGIEISTEGPDAWYAVGQIVALVIFVLIAAALITIAWPHLLLVPS